MVRTSSVAPAARYIFTVLRSLVSSGLMGRMKAVNRTGCLMRRTTSRVAGVIVFRLAAVRSISPSTRWARAGVATTTKAARPSVAPRRTSDVRVGPGRLRVRAPTARKIPTPVTMTK